VKYTRKGVPDRIRGSLPTIRPATTQKRKNVEYNNLPDAALRDATANARYRSKPVQSREREMYAWEENRVSEKRVPKNGSRWRSRGGAQRR
jgi:hypothetical protein